MSVQEGLGSRADTCRYQCFSMAYTLQGSASPVEGSIHSPISVAASSACLRESAIRDRRTALVSLLATLRPWRGFCCKAARLSIKWLDSGGIQRGWGGHLNLDGPFTGSWGSETLPLPFWVPRWGGFWAGMLSFPGGIRPDNGLGFVVAVTWARSDWASSCAWLKYRQARSGAVPSRECIYILIGGRFPAWLVTKSSGLETCSAAGSVGPGLWDYKPKGGPTHAGSARSSLCWGPRLNPQGRWGPWSAAWPPKGQSGVPISRVAGTLQQAGSEWVQWLSRSLPRLACGNAWTQSPTRRASPLSPAWRRPVWVGLRPYFRLGHQHHVEKPTFHRPDGLRQPKSPAILDV